MVNNYSKKWNFSNSTGGKCLSLPQTGYGPDLWDNFSHPQSPRFDIKQIAFDTFCEDILLKVIIK